MSVTDYAEELMLEIHLFNNLKGAGWCRQLCIFD